MQKQQGRWISSASGKFLGKLLAEVMGCSVVKAKEIPHGMLREADQVADEVIDTLEQWCRWGCSRSG